MSTSGPGSGRDDLGRALLARHPRGEQWRQLDVTVANLTFEQITRMGSLGEERASDRQTARDKIIARITDPELAGRLASRWIRWKDTFGLPMPAELDDPMAVLHHPYLLAQQAPPDHSGWHKVVLPVFDAGLAIAAAGYDEAGSADYELLTARGGRPVCPHDSPQLTHTAPTPKPHCESCAMPKPRRQGWRAR